MEILVITLAGGKCQHSTEPKNGDWWLIHPYCDKIYEAPQGLTSHKNIGMNNNDPLKKISLPHSLNWDVEPTSSNDKAAPTEVAATATASAVA